MFSFKPVSNRLMSICMGITLGLAAVILYLTFLMAYTYAHSGQMILIPLEGASQSQAYK
jgi:hypothetical protein